MNAACLCYQGNQTLLVSSLTQGPRSGYTSEMVPLWVFLLPICIQGASQSRLSGIALFGQEAKMTHSASKMATVFSQWELFFELQMAARYGGYHFRGTQNAKRYFASEACSWMQLRSHLQQKIVSTHTPGYTKWYFSKCKIFVMTISLQSLETKALGHQETYGYQYKVSLTSRVGQGTNPNFRCVSWCCDLACWVTASARPERPAELRIAIFPLVAINNEGDWLLNSATSDGQLSRSTPKAFN